MTKRWRSRSRSSRSTLTTARRSTRKRSRPGDPRAPALCRGGGSGTKEEGASAGEGLTPSRVALEAHDAVARLFGSRLKSDQPPRRAGACDAFGVRDLDLARREFAYEAAEWDLGAEDDDAYRHLEAQRPWDAVLERLVLLLGELERDLIEGGSALPFADDVGGLAD